MTGVLLDAPVQPDGPTARRWAVEELAKPEYHDKRSLLGRLLEWVLDQLDKLSGVGVGGWQAAATVVVVTLVVVVLAFAVAGPVRRARAVREDGAVHDADDVRTADQMRAAADAALASGDFSTAVVERFRALVRGLEERTVLDERPGRTASEAVHGAAARLPAVAGELDRAAASFSDVAYGGRAAARADAERLAALDVRVQHERPSRPAAAAAVAASTGVPT
ncbi:DUF4129 domain-containing protein [Cellulomonas sp. HZM]|uniref:DUF4129 domain-containing protein n=1 Tax=Cellulomonas sp. HZM TaxID=1454010 RepID=UPI00068FEAA1|nr:DUF4129 domain-containing protein [Cellulomonas sp. HZM]